METTECVHDGQWFDRTLCAEPCGTMHTWCSDCGERLDSCAHDGMPKVPCCGWKRAYDRDMRDAIEETDRALSVIQHLIDVYEDDGEFYGQDEKVAAWDDAKEFLREVST